MTVLSSVMLLAFVQADILIAPISIIQCYPICINGIYELNKCGTSYALRHFTVIMLSQKNAEAAHACNL
jgi:hypothetical protein